MCAQVVAPLYAEVLQQAGAALGPGEELRRLWPRRQLQPPWAGLLEGFYAAVADRAVVPCAAAGGAPFVTPRRAVFPDAMAARLPCTPTPPPWGYLLPGPALSD